MTAWNDPDLDALSETTRRFAQQHILPYQNEWESSGQVPRELSAEAGKLGLLGTGFAESAGGGGGARAATAVSEALHEAGVGGGVVSALFVMATNGSLTAKRHLSLPAPGLILWSRRCALGPQVHRAFHLSSSQLTPLVSLLPKHWTSSVGGRQTLPNSSTRMCECLSKTL